MLNLVSYANIQGVIVPSILILSFFSILFVVAFRVLFVATGVVELLGFCGRVDGVLCQRGNGLSVRNGLRCDFLRKGACDDGERDCGDLHEGDLFDS